MGQKQSRVVQAAGKDFSEACANLEMLIRATIDDSCRVGTREDRIMAIFKKSGRAYDIAPHQNQSNNLWIARIRM